MQGKHNSITNLGCCSTITKPQISEGSNQKCCFLSIPETKSATRADIWDSCLFLSEGQIGNVALGIYSVKADLATYD
eukprot:2441768-Amphidinium_carterae.1